MNREEALQLVRDWTKKENLVKHMLAVEAAMRAIYKNYENKGISEESVIGLTEEDWGIAGLLHDADYEMFYETPEKHPSKIYEELEKRRVKPAIVEAVKSHAWGGREDLPKPRTLMDWGLYCSDDLAGFIVACALVRPSKKLAEVSVDSVLRKWKEKSFAAGVCREQIELCQEKLGISLVEFIEIVLKAMQEIADELGL